MIPATMDRATESPGEREVFLRLRDDPMTAQWTVLHSLDLVHHPDQITAEIDFVVIIPTKGVLCIEVKACRSMQRRDGLWFYGANPTGDPRGPFKQASSAMQGLRGRVADRLPALRNVVFWSAVIFPYIRFQEASDEWHPWQVIDATRFRSLPLSRAIEDVLDAARNYIAGRSSATWFHPGTGTPNTSQSAQLAQTLRPEFEVYQSMKSRTARREQELKRYTTEQFLALDALQSYPRVIYTAPAGAGKTLLALEACRRASSENRRTLLLCYNRLLGDAIRREADRYEDLVTAATLHGYLLRVSGIEAVPENARNQFWQDELPERAIEILLGGEGACLFDELVVDEAQDLLNEKYLDVLDLSLKGGFAAGRWRFFGDFEKQAIFDSADLKLSHFIEQRCPKTPIYELRVNCRNTPRIASLTSLLGGMDPPYTRILRQDDGLEADIKFFLSAEQQIEMLTGSLAALDREGYRPAEIVILSTRASDSCAEQVPRGPWKDRMDAFQTERNDLIRWTTIHAFKGLESPVVIVTDVNEIVGPRAQSLFYVAVTRATDRLVILAATGVRKQLVDSLVQVGRVAAAQSSNT